MMDTAIDTHSDVCGAFCFKGKFTVYVFMPVVESSEGLLLKYGNLLPEVCFNKILAPAVSGPVCGC